MCYDWKYNCILLQALEREIRTDFIRCIRRRQDCYDGVAGAFGLCVQNSFFYCLRPILYIFVFLNGRNRVETMTIALTFLFVGGGGGGRPAPDAPT